MAAKKRQHPHSEFNCVPCGTARCGVLKRTDMVTGTIGEGMRWIDVRKPSDGFEPEWEEYVDATTIRIIKRLYRLANGQDYPEGEIISPALAAVIGGEIKKLVNELTYDWY
jgi:hypothetical protein